MANDQEAAKTTHVNPQKYQRRTHIGYSIQRFINDSQAVADRIYQHFCLPYPNATRQLIAGYIADHPRDKHGSHDYQREQFGLNEQQVPNKFDSYIEQFDIVD